MAGNEFWARKIIAAYVELRRTTEQIFITYGELADLIGRKGEHRLLGGALDLVRDRCCEMGVPDIATVVIDKESLKRGEMRPSPKAIDKYEGWQNLRAEQARVITFDWSAVNL
ncbi:hypothetical protein TRL7639_02643 [Falsiruegeria litorea R37]|uniref:Uncharacterized protein n=1 Tax=Falsiruegeria litorea R37 TaxID=1200284 RepID=A0A1Y5STK2_9RHOB|nr:hypothetical protein [Falsiruegeria litorea]SLN48097.1 hypothetical protein TRL7639_02643 [Falsiruegeria litorea R37]